MVPHSTSSAEAMKREGFFKIMGAPIVSFSHCRVEACHLSICVDLVQQEIAQRQTAPGQNSIVFKGVIARTIDLKVNFHAAPHLMPEKTPRSTCNPLISLT